MKNNQIYRKYIENIFEPGIITRLGKEYEITKQGVSWIINKSAKDLEDEVKRYREEQLAETKYIHIKPKTEEQQRSLVHAMVLDGFVYRDIENITGIHKSKITKLLKTVNLKRPTDKLTIRIWRA